MRTAFLPSPKLQSRIRQQGGITILVCLMLLVLLTLSAIGLSRNAFREILATGTARQGVAARNLADSGIEYAILWLQPNPLSPALAGTPAAQLQAERKLLMDGNLFGQPYKVADGSLYTGTDNSTPVSGQQIPDGSGNGFNLSLTCMGYMNLNLQGTTGGSTTGGGYNVQAGPQSQSAPTIWSVRSDGVLNAGGVMKFLHSKETWISTPLH